MLTQGNLAKVVELADLLERGTVRSDSYWLRQIDLWISRIEEVEAYSPTEEDPMEDYLYHQARETVNSLRYLTTAPLDRTIVYWLPWLRGLRRHWPAIKQLRTCRTARARGIT